MKAITIPRPDHKIPASEALVLAEVTPPTPRPDEVLISVVAAGVNRADLLQRQGFYPPPPGVSAYPGLEVSGVVKALGHQVTEWQVGDEVCALLDGGGYAEQVAVPAVQVLPCPTGIGLVHAAALPEVACTVWSNVFMTAQLGQGETLLVHGGSSGIGTMAIQLAHAHGCRVITTASTEAKLDACRTLGADVAINYQEEDFVSRVAEATDGHGADVILDVVGAKYLERNLAALAVNGRLVVIGFQGGIKAEINLNTLLGKRGALIATSLRARPQAEKAAIVEAVRTHVWPLVEAGTVRPLTHTVLPLAEAATAHGIIKESSHIGKVLLAVQ